MNENFIFKYLDAPYSETEMAALLQMHPNVPGRFMMLDLNRTLDAVPTIASWFKQINIVPTKAALISVGPNVSQVIHTDSGQFTLAINFPVYNCNTTSTYFYNTEPSDVKVGYTIGTKLPYNYFENLKIESVAGQYILNKPCILNIKKPHSVVNLTNDSRISLSFRFEKDPWFLTE